MTLSFSFSGGMKKNPTSVILLLLCFTTMPGFCSGDGNPDAGFIEVTGADVRLSVPDAGRIFGPGDSIPLLQETPDFFILALPDGSPAAVRKFDRKGNPIAWVTQQKQLIFGERVRATGGFIHLRTGDEFRILRDAQNTWVVEFSAFQNRAELSIPKKIPAGLAYNPPEPEPVMEEAPPRPVQIAEAKPAVKPVVRPAPKPKPPPAAPPAAETQPAAPAPVAVPVVEVNPPEIKPPPVMAAPIPEMSPMPQSAPEAPAAAPPAPVEIPASEPTPAEPAPVPPVEPEQPDAALELSPETPEPEQSVVVEEQEPPPADTNTAEAAVTAQVDAEKPAASSAPAASVVRFLDKYMLSSCILLLIVIVEGLFIIRLRRREKAEPAGASKEEPVAVLPQLDTNPFKKYFQGLRTSTGQISGPFGNFTTYELVYYLHIAKETGGLELEQHKGMVSAEMFFSNGEIVHAFVGNKVDDEAVLEILCMQCEIFNYTHLPVIIEQHTIHNPTANFLIAAAPAPATAPAEPPAEAETPVAETETGDGEPAAEKTSGGEAEAMLASLLEDEKDKPAQTSVAGDESDPEWDEIMKSLKVLDDMNDKKK